MNSVIFANILLKFYINFTVIYIAFKFGLIALEVVV